MGGRHGARALSQQDGEACGKWRRTADGDGSAASVVAHAGGNGAFDALHDELVVSIFADVAASADSPADLFAFMLTCRRFRELGQNKPVLARASLGCVTVRAGAWCDDAHRFLLRCAYAGNVDASYLLGMIQFYCLKSRRSGSALIVAAALRGHAEALYSLAVIHFNGSGRSKDARNLLAGVQLCARAALQGHNDALRELGHCVSDGYGVRRSLSCGRRLLIQANFRELCATFATRVTGFAAGLGLVHECKALGTHMCLLSDFGCQITGTAVHRAHAANAFLVEWFTSRLVGVGGGDGAPRLCSQPACGRPETRQHEFRRCAMCGVVIYCSRACQALHWKGAHQKECIRRGQWLATVNVNANDGAVVVP
ncbi:hypothetical protein GUJ93_ZPchr0006g46385 [Zizania palustris]|uniref:MYND-type domain-containing protein n=1 Tax=Zizania palustris TaxID=103762 RepID=A0A8J5VHF3_ZIZPA|nr:hypothetical protein GUJ93_ZPchr0006g46385 [Zizania palustris]